MKKPYYKNNDDSLIILAGILIVVAIGLTILLFTKLTFNL